MHDLVIDVAQWNLYLLQRYLQRRSGVGHYSFLIPYFNSVVRPGYLVSVCNKADKKIAEDIEGREVINGYIEEIKIIHILLFIYGTTIYDAISEFW